MRPHECTVVLAGAAATAPPRPQEASAKVRVALDTNGVSCAGTGTPVRPWGARRRRRMILEQQQQQQWLADTS